ncbi:SRPBCC family protein [Croceitalea sp. MTPC5]|uniref:SRPBCC family protein n=1 Tax=Croceitalea sp. MTPC5 TaxID=3056565 RepID=UPI002B3A764D|nr:SRPBCC family protein [Croceitalea sp. MTPC5]
MKLYQLRAKQAFPITKEKAWEFLSDPKNLKVITPEHMGFHILSGADRPMYQGQLIQYRVSPFPGFKTKWVSEITHVKEGEYFVDVQLFGPYALWHHKHFINEIDGGIEMEDIIDYKIPLGILGQIAHPLIVKKQLLRIFAFREAKLNSMFGILQGYTNSLKIKSI